MFKKSIIPGKYPVMWKYNLLTTILKEMNLLLKINKYRV